MPVHHLDGAVPWCRGGSGRCAVLSLFASFYSPCGRAGLPSDRRGRNLLSFVADGRSPLGCDRSAQAAVWWSFSTASTWELWMVARERAASEVPGEFVSRQLQADCARFLQEAQELAARRRQRASAHVLGKRNSIGDSLLRDDPELCDLPSRFLLRSPIHRWVPQPGWSCGRTAKACPGVRFDPLSQTESLEE